MDGQMLKKHFKRMALAASVGTFALLGASASAATLEDIFELSAEGTRIAQASQERVDALSNETQAMLLEYRTLLRAIEDLQAYNIQKEREIADQNEEIDKLNSSIERATMIDRQIIPLIEKMINELEVFINNDLPFYLEERREGVLRLRDYMDESEITTSEKFRLVFQAYQAEHNYGRELGVEESSITINGQELGGKLLHIGRVGLYFQNQDQSVTAIYNPINKGWEELDSSYTRPVNQAIKIAEDQIPPDLIRLPIYKADAE